MNVLLVYPRNPESFWSFKHVLRFVSKKCAFPPLGLLTVAAMLPREWNLRLVDLNVSNLNEDQIRDADYVFMSGMIVHKQSAHEIAARCAALGKTVVAGGPLFTTGYQEFPEIPHFVLGEAEEVIGQLVADMQRGTLQPVYRTSGWPDINKTPVPRWDLIDIRDYVTMPVQFSRGCPFDCEFCDIVVMNGRIPRTKGPAQVVRELEALRLAGWKDMVFIVDDNFIGHRKHAKELLKELIAWRERVQPTIGFLTEASVNLAGHPELCELMVQAGFRKVFLGIETPSAESLEECGKAQNRKRDLADSVTTLQRAGLEVMGGFIVGFDSDPPDIFARQFEFIQRTGVVTAMVGLLTALPETALYRRLAREGRILAETCGDNTSAALNFVTRLDRELMISGYRDLMHRLYAPGNYYRRIAAFLRSFEPRGPMPRLSFADVKAFLKSLWLLGVRHPGRSRYWMLFWSTLLLSPRKLQTAVELSILGYHFRKVASSL
ncbi:MAG: B12-binding domain-containing radical SAM protein [Betaproteobacteria bacterium]|nr:MAG: B12-binding domain-containing radical SAM protein [Betaproteobacteria bacterium]